MIHEALLRGLPAGGVMWLQAAGFSLWPLLHDGDSVRVERVHASALVPGDLAVVKAPSGKLVLHLVVRVDPLQTASTAGRLDEGPLEGLARVTAFRRDGRVFPWPRSLRVVLRWWPAAAVQLKRSAVLRAIVGRFRGV